MTDAAVLRTAIVLDISEVGTNRKWHGLSNREGVPPYCPGQKCPRGQEEASNSTWASFFFNETHACSLAKRHGMAHGLCFLVSASHVLYRIAIAAVFGNMHIGCPVFGSASHLNRSSFRYATRTTAVTHRYPLPSRLIVVLLYHYYSIYYSYKQ